jgi:putative endonuclease
MNLGKEGEDNACGLIERKGFEIIARNYRYDRAETDVIAKSDKLKILLFVEVKTRASSGYAEPEDSITHRKMNQMIKSAEGFLMQHEEFENYEKRFDVISVIINKNRKTIKHIENIF